MLVVAKKLHMYAGKWRKVGHHFQASQVHAGALVRVGVCRYPTASELADSIVVKMPSVSLPVSKPIVIAEQQEDEALDLRPSGQTSVEREESGARPDDEAEDDEAEDEMDEDI